MLSITRELNTNKLKYQVDRFTRYHLQVSQHQEYQLIQLLSRKVTNFVSGKKPDTKLNDDQEKVWETVQKAIQGSSSNTIFVRGDGGTGKTFLFNTIISRLQDMRIRVIPSAFTECAATLDWRSYHSFGLQIWN